jgi:hypothetical protein
MDPSELTSVLLAGLLDLEKSGDLVITHSSPGALADQLCAQIVKHWGKVSLDVPIEAVIDTGTKSATQNLAEVFGLADAEASAVMKSFVRSLGERRTPREVAELIAHQGPAEIACGAFFCSYLRRGAYYSSDYLDWREDHYAQTRRT